MSRIFIEMDGWEIEEVSRLTDWLDSEAIRAEAPLPIDFILVDNESIAALHSEFLDVEGPTDVITFDLRETDDEITFPITGDEIEPARGEVYISLEQAMLQAKEYSVSSEEELARLALHGILHLAGMDDETEVERAEMHRRENDGLVRARGVSGSLGWRLVPVSGNEGMD